MQLKTAKDFSADRQEHIRQLCFEAMTETLKNWGMLDEAADRFSEKLRDAGIMPALDDVNLAKETFKKGE